MIDLSLVCHVECWYIVMSTTFSILLLLFGTLLDAHAHANLIISNVCGFFEGVYRSAIQTSFILHGKCFYIHRCD